MIVQTILGHRKNPAKVLILKEKGGEKVLTIIVGHTESEAIVAYLKKMKSSRPMTHDLLLNCVHDLGGEVEKILISDIKDHAFYAKICLKVDSNTLEIDSRTSDAIAVGLRANVPIFASESVIQEAAFDLSEITKKREFPEEYLLGSEKTGDNTKSSVVENFIDSLDENDIDDDNDEDEEEEEEEE